MILAGCQACFGTDGYFSSENFMRCRNAVDLESTDPLVCQSTDFQISETSGTSASQPYYPLRDLQEQPDPAKDSVKLVPVDSFGSETVTESKDDLTPKEHVYLHKKQSKHHNLSERKRKGIPKQEQSVGSDSLGYSDIPCNHSNYIHPSN